LAATGSQLDAGDALSIGLGTHAVRLDAWPSLVEALAEMQWRGDASDAERIEGCIAGVRASAPGGSLTRVAPQIERALASWSGPPRDLAQRIDALAATDPWLERGAQTLRRGCPTSVGIVIEQIERVAKLALADCFRMELVVATHCARNGDFREGVRALIVDKDNAPKFRFGSVDALDGAYVRSHFDPPWPRNPLHDLEVA